MSKRKRFRTLEQAHEAIARDETHSTEAYVDPAASDAVDEAEERVTIGDLVRQTTPSCRFNGHHESAAAFHAVEVAMGALKRAAEAALPFAGEPQAGRLRELISEL